MTGSPATALAAMTPAAAEVRRGRALVHVPCNHCGHEVTHNVHNVSRLVKCVNCGLMFVNPRPAFEELARQYESSYFHCPEPTFGGYEDYEADRDQILRTFRGRLKELGKFVTAPSPHLLDVGCATGIFLEAARDVGWRGEGVDISEYALERAREKGLSVTRGTLNQAGLPDETYDVMTMWDLIEHVPDPAAVLAECRRLLKPGGVLAISTPDAGSLPARALRGRWLGFRSIDEHLYFFSRATLTTMLETAGFEVRGVYPMGKYLTLPRLIERMRFYSRIASRLLRAVDRLLPRISIYVNSFDTMVIVATRNPD